MCSNRKKNVLSLRLSLFPPPKMMPRGVKEYYQRRTEISTSYLAKSTVWRDLIGKIANVLYSKVESMCSQSPNHNTAMLLHVILPELPPKGDYHRSERHNLLGQLLKNKIRKPLLLERCAIVMRIISSA